MNSLQQKIDLIKKAIEAQTGKGVIVNDNLPHLIFFETILPLSGEIYCEAKIPKYILELLPLSPNSDACKRMCKWLLENRPSIFNGIDISHEDKKAICREFNYSDSMIELEDLPNKEGWIAVETEKPKIGERVLTFSGDQMSLPQMRVAVMDEDNRFWIGINNILYVTHWQPLPLPPTRNTCQTCGKEIMGSGYCSKECSNEGFKKDEI